MDEELRERAELALMVWAGEDRDEIEVNVADTGQQPPTDEEWKQAVADADRLVDLVMLGLRQGVRDG